MPSLTDLQKTKEELTLALTELDNLERATRNIELSEQNRANGQNETESHAEKEVDFLKKANKDLSEKNDALGQRFEKVNTEKDSLKNDIACLRVISQKLQVIF